MSDSINKKEYIICKVRPAGANISFYYKSKTRNIHKDDYVEIAIEQYDICVFGIVEEVIFCYENTLPCNVKEIKGTISKIGVRKFESGLLRSVIYVGAALTAEKLINNVSTEPFNAIQKSPIKIAGTIPWAYARGMSSEIIRVLEHLIEKDSKVYEYSDIIFSNEGFSELFIYADDVLDIIKNFPDVKLAMFAENKNNHMVKLYYSRSGYAEITDSYDIGVCDLESKSNWTVKHLPIDDFTDGEIVHKFKFRDDWISENYVFTDKNKFRKQLRK